MIAQAVQRIAFSSVAALIMMTSPASAAAQEAIGDLPAAALDRVVGRYDFGNGFIILVTRDGVTLRAMREGIVGAPALPIYPEAPLAFFWKVVDAQLRFTTDTSGTVTGAEFQQGALKLVGKRTGP